MTAECEVARQLIRERPSSSESGAIFEAPERTAWHLLILNIALQIFAGVASYKGLRLGCGEQTPFLRAPFQRGGVGPMLVLFTLFSCVALGIIYHGAKREFVVPAFWMVAGYYTLGSLIPWLVILVSIL